MTVFILQLKNYSDELCLPSSLTFVYKINISYSFIITSYLIKLIETLNKRDYRFNLLCRLILLVICKYTNNYMSCADNEN